jgi:predicted transposase YdaD
VNETADYDGAWKEALEVYLRPFLEFCFPTAAAGIDWGTPVEFLDKELHGVVRDSDLGNQRVDKLVRVRRLDGTEEWVLVHVEVQSQPDPNLGERLYQYHYRIRERYGRRVASLALLADEQKNWKPSSYEEELWGCRVRFDYPVCKLLDFGPEQTILDRSDNPAAILVAAHLATQSTRGDMESRKTSKWQLTRRLYERGYTRNDILELFRLLDWFLVLPEGLEIAFRADLVNFEREKTMPYVTSIERLGRQEGRREGIIDLSVRLARKRFPSLAAQTETAIRGLPQERLESLSEALLDFTTLAELEAWLQTGPQQG